MNLIYELSDLSSAATLSGRFCLTLLHSIWIIALITLIAWCVSRILQSRFVEQSYYVCVLGLFASIATLPITYATLEVSTDTIQSAEVIPVAVVTPTPLMAVQHETTDVKPVLTAAADIEAQAIVIHETNEVENASTSKAVSFLWQDFLPWILFAYLTGVVLMIVRLARSTYQANQLSSAFTLVTVGPLFETLQSVSAKLSNKIVPALALVEQTAMPKVIGVMRPTILLPTSVLTGLSQDELEMILMHELAHIRRHDMWVNLVQRMAEAVLFFNPALWLLSRRISTLREYCCDEIACKASGSQENKVTNKESRTRYASALVHIVELTHGHSKASELVSLSIAGRSPSELRRRIARLFDEPLREPIRITRGGIIALLATLAILLASPLAWQTQAQNSSAEQPEENEVVQGEKEQTKPVDKVDDHAPLGKPVLPLVKEQFPELAQVKTGISKEKFRSALGDSTKSRLFRVDSKAGRKSKYTYKFEIRDTTFFATFANDKMVELDRVKTSEYQNPLAPPAGLSPRETVNQFLDRLAEGKKTINGIRESSEHFWAYTTREEGWGLEMIHLAERPAFRAVAHLGNEHQMVVLTAIEKTSVSSVQPRVGVFGLIKKNGRWLIQKMESYKPESAWSLAEGFSRNKDVHWGILRSDIVGSFNYFDINYHFKADGSYRQTERDMATATGTWQLNGDRLIRVIDGKEHSSRILRLFEEGFIVEPKKGYQQGYYRIKPSGKSKTKSTTIDSGDLDETNNEQIPALNPSLMNGQYSFTGTVTTEMGTHKFVHSFKGKTSPNTFECSWEQDMGHMIMTGSVKTNFDAGVLKLLNMKEQKYNAELAIGGSSGVSGGSAHLMYYLWKGNRSKFFPSKDIKILKKKDLTIITGTYGNSFRTITMKKGNIISIETLSDPAKNKMPSRPEMTDDQIKDVLKLTNKEVTPKAVADMKEMLSKAKKSLSQLKDPIKTKTVFTITH